VNYTLLLCIVSPAQRGCCVVVSCSTGSSRVAVESSSCSWIAKQIVCGKCAKQKKQIGWLVCLQQVSSACDSLTTSSTGRQITQLAGHLRRLFISSGP
jgi:hypothetical protein